MHVRRPARLMGDFTLVRSFEKRDRVEYYPLSRGNGVGYTRKNEEVTSIEASLVPSSEAAPNTAHIGEKQ
jgi:hypothetical protein